MQAAGEHTHVVATTVHLHACAVQLPLHARRAGDRERVGDRGGGAGEHRLHPDQRRQADVERLAGERSRRRCAEVAEQHRRPPKVRSGHARRLRHRVGPDALVRPLTHLAAEQAHEVRLLGRGQPSEQRRQLLFTVALRTAPCRGREAGDRLVELAHLHRRLLRRGHAGVAQPDPAHPHPALARLADQQTDDDGHLRGCCPTQQRRQQRGLLRTLRGGGHLLRGLDDRGVLHPPIQARAVVPCGSATKTCAASPRT